MSSGAPGKITFQCGFLGWTAEKLKGRGLLVLLILGEMIRRWIREMASSSVLSNTSTHENPFFFSLFCWWFFTDSDPAKVHHHCSLNPPFGGRFLSSWKSTAGMLMSWCRFLQVKHRCVFVYGGFLKWWVYPTTMGFPIKNHHFWFFVGASPFKETPIWYPRGWHVTRLWFWFEWYLVLCKTPSSSWNYSSINSWCSIYPSTGTS